MTTRYIVDESGERQGVVLSVEEYERLLKDSEALEEIEDQEAAAVFDRMRGEIERGETETVPWGESKRRCHSGR